MAERQTKSLACCRIDQPQSRMQSTGMSTLRVEATPPRRWLFQYTISPEIATGLKDGKIYTLYSRLFTVHEIGRRGRCHADRYIRHFTVMCGAA